MRDGLIAAEFPAFEMQQIDGGLKIGYAVIIEDIDADGRPDIVVVDQHQVAWYRNPGERQQAWSKHLILDGQTRPDNVCITAVDITGDGLPELVLGAGWKPFDTLSAGQLVWLKRGPRVTDPWTMFSPPCDQPMVHRVRAIDIDGDGRPEIVHVPLMGRGATREGNWSDGRPLEVIALKIPAEPENPLDWQQRVLSQQLQVAQLLYWSRGSFARPGSSLLLASYDGISLLYPEGTDDSWTTRLLHPAEQRQSPG